MKIFVAGPCGGESGYVSIVIDGCENPAPNRAEIPLTFKSARALAASIIEMVEEQEIENPLQR
jgi:hypothetical protein